MADFNLMRHAEADYRSPIEKKTHGWGVEFRVGFDLHQWVPCWKFSWGSMGFDLTIPAQNPVDFGIFEYAPFEGIAAKAALVPHAELLQDAPGGRVA